jgi:excisionase family DNA binding protein
MESMDQSGSDRDLMTVADAARELSRSTEQVRRYLREGRLAGRRMGGQWFIERAAVESFGKAATKEDQFTRKLRPARRVRPLDDVIGIGEGPGSDISSGKHQYRVASLRRR